MKPFPVCLLIAAAAAGSAQRGTLVPLPAEETAAVAAAVRAAAAARRLPGAPELAFTRLSERPAAYRLGEAEFWVFLELGAADAPASGDRSIAPAAVIVTRRAAPGDFRRMLAADDGNPLAADGRLAGMRVFALGLRSQATGRQLEVLGMGSEPLLRLPARRTVPPPRGQELPSGPLVLRMAGEQFVQLTFTLDGYSAELRLGPPAPEGSDAPRVLDFQLSG